MAGAQTLTDDDDDDLQGAGGTTNLDALTPPAAPVIRQQDDPAADDTFEVIELDDDGQPIGGAAPARQGEARLTDADEGAGTLVEQQQRAKQGLQPRSRAERRQAQKAGRDRTQRELDDARRELAELRQQVNGFTPRFQQFDASQRASQVGEIDRQINEQAQIVRTSEAAVADAIKRLALGEDSAGNDLAAANRAAYQAIARGQTLTNQKAQLEASPVTGPARADEGDAGSRTERQPAAEPRTIPLNRNGQSYVSDFSQRYDWFDVKGGDLASRTVLAIDREVMAEGFNPNTQDYWDEVEARCAEVMPHRFAEAAEPTRPNGQRQAPATRQAAPSAQRRGPMTATGEGRPAPASGNKVYVTPERKKAMMESGSIDSTGRVMNKEKFQRQMRSFRDFDQQNPRA